MRSIWKYSVPITDETIVMTPPGARFLGFVEVYLETRILWLWAEVVAGARPTEQHLIYVVGTGNPLPEPASWLGSVRDGSFIWHVYDGGIK